MPDPEEFSERARVEVDEPLTDEEEWLLMLFVRWLLATAGWGSGFVELGGGGGGAAAAAAAALDSLVFEEEDSVDLLLLSCRGYKWSETRSRWLT